MQKRSLRNLEFNTEYLPKLRERVAQNKRFEIIKLRRKIPSNRRNIPDNSLPILRVQLKTNAANKAVAEAAKIKGYNRTNLKVKNKNENHTVYRKEPGEFYVKTQNKNYEKLKHHVLLKKPNGSVATVSSLLNNNNYNTNKNTGTYVNVRPVNITTVYLESLYTTPTKRGKEYGKILSKFATNAAKNAGMKMYMVAVNLEHLVNKGNEPISGKIIRKYGGVLISPRNVPASIREGYTTHPWWYMV